MNPLAEPCTVCGAAVGAPCTVTMRHGNEAAQCCAPHESRGKPAESFRWTLHGCGDAASLKGFFASLPAATSAWNDEGKPEGPNGPPSATEHRVCGKSVDSVRTVALAKHENRGTMVFLDDERPVPNGWIGVRWPAEAISLLSTGGVTDISLDHDLGDDARGTGYDVILWIEEAVAVRGFVPPRITVHSANASAREKMLNGIRSIERFAQWRAP